MAHFIFMVVSPLISSILITFAYPPQVIKNYRTKSVSDLSTIFWITISTFCLTMLGNAGYLYFTGAGSLGYMITEIINLVFASTILIQIIYYKKFYKGKRQLTETEQLKAIIKTQKKIIEELRMKK